MGVKSVVLLNFQPPTIPFTVIAQQHCPPAKETEMGVALFTKTMTFASK